MGFLFFASCKSASDFAAAELTGTHLTSLVLPLSHNYRLIINQLRLFIKTRCCAFSIGVLILLT
jgi:hypothetical protein